MAGPSPAPLDMTASMAFVFGKLADSGFLSSLLGSTKAVPPNPNPCSATRKADVIPEMISTYPNDARVPRPNLTLHGGNSNAVSTVEHQNSRPTNPNLMGTRTARTALASGIQETIQDSRLSYSKNWSTDTPNAAEFTLGGAQHNIGTIDPLSLNSPIVTHDIAVTVSLQRFGVDAPMPSTQNTPPRCEEHDGFSINPTTMVSDGCKCLTLRSPAWRCVLWHGYNPYSFF